MIQTHSGFFHRHQRAILICITLIVCVSFPLLYNPLDNPSGGDNYFGSAFGRTVSITEYKRAARERSMARMLGLGELAQLGAGRSRNPFDFNADDTDGVESYLWNVMVLRREAAALGIEPSVAQVEEAIMGNRGFQTPDGKFDKTVWENFVKNSGGPVGMAENQLQEIVRDSLRLGGVKALVAGAVVPQLGDLPEQIEKRHRKLEVSFTRLVLADFLGAVQISDDDAKKLYEERKANYMSDELRKVRFAAFTLEKSDKPLVGPERVEAMAKLSETASEFQVAAAEKDAKFDEVAAKFGAKPAEVEFAQADPPAELGEAAEAAAAAFQLKKEAPLSDIVITDNGYYVLLLVDVKVPRQLTFDESKEKLLTAVKRERAIEQIDLKAREIRTKIDEALKAGKTFAEAATAAGAKPEAAPAFTQAEPPRDFPGIATISRAVAQLEAGKLSEVTPEGEARIIARLEKSEPADPEKVKADVARYTEQNAQRYADQLFMGWLQDRRSAAGITSITEKTVPAAPTIGS